MIRVLTVLIFVLFSAFYATAQTAPNQTSKNKNPKKSGVVFKVPADVFPMDWKKSGFKGMLMLRKDSPSGIFICYPDDNESIEALRERAAGFIAPMFVRDEKEQKEITFQKSPIPNHKGDSGDSALYYSHANEKSLIQILFYERAANNTKFIYGYFAMKNKDAKDKAIKDIWADDKGSGVKIFEKFWKTLDE
jgi:hypothetical protein